MTICYIFDCLKVSYEMTIHLIIMAPVQTTHANTHRSTLKIKANRVTDQQSSIFFFTMEPFY